MNKKEIIKKLRSEFKKRNIKTFNIVTTFINTIDVDQICDDIEQDYIDFDEQNLQYLLSDSSSDYSKFITNIKTIYGTNSYTDADYSTIIQDQLIFPSEKDCDEIQNSEDPWGDIIM